MLIHSATQLLTLSPSGGASRGGPQRGRELGKLGLLENGAVLIREEKVVAVGQTADLRAAHQRLQRTAAPPLATAAHFKKWWIIKKEARGPAAAANTCRSAAHRKTHQHCLTSIMIETVYFLKMAMVNDAL